MNKAVAQYKAFVLEIKALHAAGRTLIEKATEAEIEEWCKGGKNE